MRVTDAADLGRVLRSARQAKGWSQQRLADAAGLSRDWVVRAESGSGRLEVQLVLKALGALDLSIDVTEAMQEADR
ncbi:MAG: helix-turn-helix domain-containing protein [Actinomycetes bacterium]|jgi:transcriptional regulator with XRE-family HTH domain